MCFSFGTFWNKGCFAIDVLSASTNGIHSAAEKSKSSWKYVATGAATVTNTSKIYSGPQLSSNSLLGVPQVKILSSEEFGRIVEANKPVILKGSDLGLCTDVWTPDYLKDKVGTEREVCKIFKFLVAFDLSYSHH